MVVEHPLETLRETGIVPAKHLAAMNQLDASPDDADYLKALTKLLWKPGVTVPVRESALLRLEQGHPELLQTTLRRQIPRLSAPRWLDRLGEIIVDRGWIDLTPALVSRWSVPTISVVKEEERAEYKTLAALHGSDRVVEVVFETLLDSNKPSQQGLRTRCWNLLHRLGERDRLIELLTQTEPPEDDAFLRDLHRVAREIGMIPHNREEILWLRKLLLAEKAEFWSRAVSAVESFSTVRRRGLEIRDLPILVSAALHEPEMFTLSNENLFTTLAAELQGRKHYTHGTQWSGNDQYQHNRLHHWRDVLTWGDLAAIRIAIRALQVPEVVKHFFNYADRDHADESTEYGGVVKLDRKNRFEIIEFIPRIRQHDHRFNAPQAMLDAAYTALFHFHFHVQRYRNDEYAGPGFGDNNYANNLRANCLVLTFINRDTLNVDFYRHGGVLIDLGVITRP